MALTSASIVNPGSGCTRAARNSSALRCSPSSSSPHADITDSLSYALVAFSSSRSTSSTYSSLPNRRAGDRLERAAQFHVAMKNLVEKPMVSRASLLPPEHLFRSFSCRSNRRDSGPRIEVHVPDQEYLAYLVCFPSTLLSAWRGSSLCRHSNHVHH